MKELTFEEFCHLTMTYTTGIGFVTYAQRLYRNEAYGIQKETFTPRNARTMEWGLGQVFYFVDGDPRQFETVDQCYVAYMEKVCGVRSIE